MQEESAAIAGNERLRGTESHPVRTLVSLALSASAIVGLLLLHGAADGRSPTRHPGLSTWISSSASDTDSTALDLRVVLDSTLPDGQAVAVPDGAELRVVADTDSVHVEVAADSLLLAPGIPDDSVLLEQGVVADSFQLGLQVDGTQTVDTLLTPRADFYLPRRKPDSRLAAPVRRRDRPFYPRLGNYWQHDVALDSTSQSFVIRESVGNIPVRDPLRLRYDDYRDYRLKSSLEYGWRDVMDQRARQRQRQSRGGLGFNIVVPGGQQSAFTTIFGKPTVDLRVNGQADIKAGFNYRKSDQQVAVTGRPSQVDPDFKQDLRLGITGTIGDKLRVDVNWDTNNQFDYQNQLRLQYHGYEDEIIQNIEAGNVHLNTPSRLIRGGQSLFGIKSQFRLGGLQLTTVASQQEGQSNSLSIDGGSQTTTIDLQPTDYDDNTHYFLGYYFRNRWEEALSEPPTVIVSNGFETILELEVWKLQQFSPEEEDVRNVVAMVDLGEEPTIVDLADAYDREVLPSEDIDRYGDGDLQQLRTGTAQPQEYLKQLGLSDHDMQPGQFKKLRPGADYEFDRVLGYISLNQRLQENEALAVAFRYRANGATHTVGDFSTETGGSEGGQNSDRLVLKLLKPVQLRQPAPENAFNPAAWYLELRNIYRLPGRGLNPNDFELQIEYQPPGRPGSRVVPDLAGGGQRTLLQLLGFDRLNVDEAPRPDDRFDYLSGFTIDPQDGELIFPYLQPFGSRINRIIDELDEPESEKQKKRQLYVFNSLYTKKKELARKETQYDVYFIRGSYKGSVQDFYDLRAYAGLVEGSVVVTSGGSRLTEGVDYTVDYQGGTVQITNPAFLTAGRNIEISYEQNSFFNLQKKTLLGARADYIFSDNLAIGGTLFNLNQKSPIDKFRIGEEPISNTIWGVDGAIDLQPQWLTRAIDALPFIQTKAPSSIQITGEFAQLRPGAGHTVAFERTRRDLRDNNRDFKSDELSGISYIDDFEGFENTFSLKQPGAWRLASAPDSIGAIDANGVQFGITADSLRTNWRGVFSWYILNENVILDLAGPSPPPAVAPVLINEVFPNRDTRGETHRFIQPLDIFFTPHQRGPYNYTRDLKSFLSDPKSVWGGMMQRLPEGYTDFTLKNVEFIEFIVKVFPEGSGDVGRDARLYVDLGSISEDVIPNGDLNTEDGLSMTDVSARNLDPWSRSTSGKLNSTIDVDDQLRRTEDLGLDGLASYSPDDYDPRMTEQFHFQDFLNSLDPNDPDPRYRAEVAKALRDPSGDDFFYFEADGYFNNPDFYPEGASIQERFSRYFPGTEINSYEAQNKLAPSIHGQRGNSRFPDTEDLNSNSAIDLTNAYFQYELPISRAVLDSMAAPERVDDYVVTEITPGGGWYQVRIPVRDFTRRVGNIQDFSLIETIRVWATGFDAPVTVRFATFELVGSQWQKSDAIALEREVPADTSRNATRLSISSINNEENPDTYKTPRGTIISQNRLATGVVQDSREQAMVLRVENLMPGKQRAIFKTYNQGLDLLKYSNLRMFAHMHGTLASGVPIESRDKVRLFLRLGANETNDYYEYEMPLTPSPAVSSDPDIIWQTFQDVNGRRMDLNSINLVLGALNQLKVARDEAGMALDSVYWTDEHQVPLSPTLEEFAPPGTRLGIKGSPSLGRINTVVLGIRNPADSTIGGAPNRNPDQILDDVTVWVNELRVSGYDETNGWAAMANADIRLADLGNIRASWRSQTDGFGGLESTLGERDQNDIANWSITTDINLDKFIPARYGWTIPFSVQVQSNTSTPRFAPNRGDIRLEELLSQVEENENLSEAERAQRRQEIIESAQTASRTQSFNTRIQKSGSRSRLLRNTVDGISFNYSFSNSESSRPSQRLNDNWRWNTTLNYRLNIRRPRTIKPFWFLGGIPILGVLGDLDFNYAPQSISAGATAARNFTATQERPRLLLPGQVQDLPEAVQYPLRETHALSHRRNMTMQYNPFQFLNLSFDANTNQSLNALGVDTLFTVVVQNNDGSESIHPNLRIAQAQDALGLDDSTQTAYQITNLRVVPTDRIINRLFSGAPGLRTEQHNERFTASFRPNLSRIKALNWITLQDVVFGSQYSWRNGAASQNTGASIGNSLEVRGGVTLRPQELFRKVSFYRSLEQAQEQSQAAREAERRERQQRKEVEERRRQAEERARQEALERGEDPPEPTQQAADSTASAGNDWFGRLLPNPVSLLRRAVLAVTGIRDLSITYSQNQSATSSNVGTGIYGSSGEVVDVETPYSLFDAIRGNGPSVGYRFGLQRHVPLYLRVIDDRLQVTDVLQDGHSLQARTSLNPSQSLQINLNWSANWDESTNQTYRRLGGIQMTETTTGQSRASIWAFRANYLDLFARQLETLRRDAAADQNPTDGRIGDENGDGRVALTNQSIVDDFHATYLSGLGMVGVKGLLPFPMPNWQVNYSGIGKWPIIRGLVASATLRHGYSSDYGTNYRVQPLTADSIRAFNIGGQQIVFTMPSNEVGNIRVNERFQPLIGVDFNFKNRFQTSVAWNKSTSYSLSTTNFEVAENGTSELTFSASYQRQGMKLPFLRKLNNRISFNLTVSRASLSDQRFSIRRGITDYLSRPNDFVLSDALQGDNISIVSASTRVTVVPRISYQFSNRVSADFTLRYENFSSEDSRQPSATTMNGGFNIRVSIAN